MPTLFHMLYLYRITFESTLYQNLIKLPDLIQLYLIYFKPVLIIICIQKMYKHCYKVQHHYAGLCAEDCVLCVGTITELLVKGGGA